MAYTQTKGISEEYSKRLYERYESNGGRVFLVDYSKSCAIKAVEDLFKKVSANTVLCVVEDAEVAKEFSLELSPVLGEFKIIDSLDLLKESLALIGTEKVNDCQSLINSAQKIKENYPRLIVTAIDAVTGKPLFNGELAKNTGKSGSYGEVSKTPYCLSDLLAECEYEFAVIDDIYKLLNFEEQKPQSKKKYPVGSYDRVDILGKEYFAKTEFSFSRLKKITDGAEHCVVISDVIVDKDMVYLYCALETLHSDFSFSKTKKQVMAVSENYVEECEKVCGDISNCVVDESILSDCLYRIKGVDQQEPEDIASMREYLINGFDYMSDEEKFLRFFNALIKYKYNGTCPPMDTVFETLYSDINEITECFCNVFFKDKIKGELEVAITNSHVAKMTKDEISTLFKVFLKYGVVHEYVGHSENCSIYRIKRDCSGFEFFARNNVSQRPDDDKVYSVMNSGSDLLYKCVMVNRLVDGREGKAGLETPMVIVSDKNTAEITSTLQKMLGEKYLVTEDINAIVGENVAQNTIAVLDYELFGETALWLDVKSAVYFDIYPDITVMKNLLNKGLCYGDVKGVILASYGDMGGYLADEWQEMLLSKEDKMLPIRNSEISIKDGTDDDYANVVTNLNKTYKLLFDMLRKGDKSKISELCENYNSVVSDFTLKVNVDQAEITSDMKYLSAVGRAVELVFENCISVDGTGEDVTVEKIVYVKNTAERKLVDERVDKEEFKRQYFNVCAQMLMRGCDMTVNSCNGCEKYKKYKRNDFAKFKENVNRFLEITTSYADKAETKVLKDLNDMKISNYDLEGGKATRLVASEVAESKKAVVNALGKLSSIVEDKQNIVCVDYQLVKKILDAVIEHYGKLLKKYFKTLMKIFNKATEKAKIDFNTVRESFASAHNV